MSKISLKHSGGNVVSLNSPTNAPSAADVAFKLPNADGSDGQALVTDGSGNLSFGAAGGGAVSNLIINGAMQIAQRATTDTSFFIRTVDRFYWDTFAHGATNTQSQADVAAGTTPYSLGFRKSFKMTLGNNGTPYASTRMAMTYKIEAQDIATSGWNYTSSSSYITFSYWVKSSVSQNFYNTFVTDDGTSQRYVTETGTLSADTWTKITKQIPGNSNLTFNNDIGEGLEITWEMYRGTDQTGTRPLNAWAAADNATRTPDQTATFYSTNGATFEITGVQLETGSTASDFEHRLFADELALCQRYYYQETLSNNQFYRGLGKADSDGNSIDLNIPFPVQMRSAPTALDQTGAATNYLIRGSSTLQCTSVPTFGSATLLSARVRFTRSSHGISTNNVANCGSWGDSFLGFSAEL